MLRQLVSTVRAIHDAHAAAQDTASNEELAAQWSGPCARHTAVAV